MRVRHTVAVAITDDQDARDYLFGRDTALAQVILEDYTKAISGSITVAAGGSMSLGFGAVTDCRGLYLQVDGDATVTIDGQDLELRANSKDTAKILIEGAMSTIEVAAVEALTGVYSLWGDPAP